jgi:adenylosuccinate synthase
MNYAVIGLAFGDEGKGMVIDYLCSQLKGNGIVIRYSGGHQAGHTVVKDGVRHVFSNFGSGTLRGIPTYWSKYCTVEPVGLIKELNILLEKSVNPLLLIDERCPIVTPFDIVANQIDQAYKENGTCGVGFGKTIEREKKFYSLTFMDIFYASVLEEKLNNINLFYGFNITKESFDNFLKACEIIRNSDYIKNSEGKLKYTDYIFEGSQGLLLDQYYGFFPNVTRSNTGAKNIIDLLSVPEFEPYLVTRAYQTRHGNGFMTNEDISHNIKLDTNETNVIHEYQGNFRKTLLDVDLLKYAINKDRFLRDWPNNLVITCMDHAQNDLRFTYNNRIIECSCELEFVIRIADLLEIDNIYISKSNESKNVKKIER